MRKLDASLPPTHTSTDLVAISSDLNNYLA